MSRTTNAVRQANADAAYAAKTCECRHPIYRHVGLDRTNPSYQPLHFHCQEPNCNCVRVAS